MQEYVDAAAFSKSAFARLECSAGASHFSWVEKGGVPQAESALRPSARRRMSY